MLTLKEKLETKWNIKAKEDKHLLRLAYVGKEKPNLNFLSFFNSFKSFFLTKTFKNL